MIEMLVYTALLGAVSASVFSFVIWSMQTAAKAKAMREVTAQADRLIRQAADAVQGAESIYAPTSVFGSDDGQLSLEIAQEGVSGEPFLFSDIYLCGSRACRKDEGADPAALTSDRVSVDALRFDPAGPAEDPRSVRMQVTVSFVSPSDRPQFQSSLSVTTSATIR